MRITIGQLLIVVDESRIRPSVASDDRQDLDDRARQTTRRIRRVIDVTTPGR